MNNHSIHFKVALNLIEAEIERLEAEAKLTKYGTPAKNQLNKHADELRETRNVIRAYWNATTA